MPHNPMLTIRENMQLDQIRNRKDSDPVVSEIGLLTGAIPETYEDGPVPVSTDLFKRLKAGGHVLPNGNIDLSGTFHWDHRIFETSLCPEVMTMPQSLFQHAGHMWLHTHYQWSSSTITGTVELYIPTAEDLVPTPVTLFEGELYKDYDGDKPVGRFSHIQQFVDIVKHTSQCTRNETMAICVEGLDIADAYPPHFSVPAGYLIKDRPDHVLDELLMQSHCESEPEVLTPEDIQDREQAMQEAAEGKLDYLLEGTQWDPRNRK